MKFPILVLVCAGLTASGLAQAGEVTLDQRFSGASHQTMVDANGDGIFASAASFQLKGSPGKATMQSMAEFTDFVFVGTSGCELRAELVQESFIETFSDGSMVFYHVEGAYICVNIATFEIGGQMSGWITGGTGRFEGATGTWIVDFEAFSVGTTQTAFTGTFKGTIQAPD